MKLKWVSSSESSLFALQILELLEEWKLCWGPCITGSSPNNSSFTHSCWQDWCFCLDMFYGYRFRIWIYVQPWDMYVFQRMLVPPSVWWMHFTEITGRCRVTSTVGLSLWLEAFWSLHQENSPICLACLSFFLPMKDNQAEFFSYRSTPSFPAWHGPSFPCSLSFSSGNEFFCSVLGVAAFILYFSWQWGKEKMRREYFACLDSWIQLVVHWGREKDLKSMDKEGKTAIS